MKVVGILLLGFLVGCASVPTFEELEQQALLTGDWSAVEKRERIIAKRQARRPTSCQAGYISVCESMGELERCGCVKRDELFGSVVSWR